MNDKQLKHKLESLIGAPNVFANEPMSRHTSFRIGGSADFLADVCSCAQIASVIALAKAENVPYFVMGNGSNLLVRDEGIRGIVIKISTGMSGIKVDGDVVIAEAGVQLSRLAKVALDSSLAGLEFAGGIPGSLGGAVVMNAGAYDGEMKQVVVETTYLNEDGEVKTIAGDEHKFGYRTGIFQSNGGIILKCKMKLTRGNPAEIKAKMDDLAARRRAKQPLNIPSAGSTFKRPEGHFAGKLIEDAGLKGFSIGGAQVSPKHSGFVVNTGGAAARDVLALIEHIQETVYAKFGVTLEPEVKVV